MISGNSFGWGVRAACVVSVLTVLGPDPLAATHYVSPWEAPYYWITPEFAAWEVQEAINDAEEGDEIMIGPGRYSGNLTVKDGVNLSGSGRDKVIISGAAPTVPAITLTWNNTVKGLTVYGSRYDGSGIYADVAVPPAKTGTLTPFHISDCTISSCAGSGILIIARSEATMIFLPDPRYATPEEWEAYSEALYDTELEIEVLGCEIRKCGGNGIAVHVEGDTDPHDFAFPEFLPIEHGFKHGTLRISDCTITGCNGAGISVEAGWLGRAQVIVEKCVVRDNGGRGISVHSTGATWNGAGAWLNNSLIVGNRGAAIFCMSWESWCWGDICPDVLYPWEETGEIYADSCTIAHNDVSVDGTLWLRNCILWGNADPEANPPFTPRRNIVRATNNCIQWSELADSDGNITKDPLFVDPENGDFTLKPSSPCIDAGGLYWRPTVSVLNKVRLAISLDPRVDLAGNPRASGEAPDIGAYECAGGETTWLLETSEDLMTWERWSFSREGPCCAWYVFTEDLPQRRFYRIMAYRP